MKLKINGEYVDVEEIGEKKKADWVYIGMSAVGTLLIFWIIDFAAFTFLYVHPFPWIVWVAKVIHFIGGIL